MTLRNRCRIFKTVCAMLFLGMLMVSVFQKGLVNTKKEIFRTPRMEVPNKYWKTDPKETHKAGRDATRRWDVTSPNCSTSENVSSAEWFDSLEPNFKQFMLYRHCRYFPIIINHPEKCSSDVHLLIVIKSMITQHDRREVIRQTWGKEQQIDGKKIKTLFLLGTSSNEQEQINHQKLLQYEDYIYGDILQWDFMDSFFNLTLKETHFLKWFSIYCDNIQYIYKGDDDIFLSVTNLMEYLDSSSGVENLFAGDVLYKARPIRKKTNKYYIPESLYNKTLYPPYAGGGGFIMDGPLARKLYSTSENLELFPIDDVFLGMCLELLNVKPIKHDAFKTFGLVKNKKSKMNKEPCFYKSMIVVHKLLPQELLDMWRLVNSDLECTLKVHPLIVQETKTDTNLMVTGFTKGLLH